MQDGSVDVGTLGKLLDLTDRRIQQLAAEGVIPKAERGRYPFVGAIQGYVRYLQERVSGDRSTSDLSTERARLAREQADKVAMANAVTRRELAPVILLTEALAQVAQQLAVRCDSLGVAVQRNAPDLPDVIKRLIVSEVEAMRALASEIKIDFKELDSEPVRDSEIDP